MNSASSLISSSASHEAYAQTEGNNTNLSYTDPSTGITFQYPSSWEILNVMPSLVPPETISAIRLIPPAQNVTQGFVDNVIISALRVANTTLSQYTEEALQAYNNLSGTVKITKSEPATLLGNPAHVIEYQERFQGQQLNKTQAWTIIGDRLYVVTYAADESEFPQHLAEVQAIIDSLQISDGAQVQQQEVQPGEQESLVPSFSSL
jgi:serine/threonine-protein kinase